MSPMQRQSGFILEISHHIRPPNSAGGSFVRTLLSAIGRARDDVLLAVCRLYFAPSETQDTEVGLWKILKM